MNVRSHLALAGFMGLIILRAGSVVFAQVDWTFQTPVVGPGDPGSWDSSRHQLGDVVYDGATYHMFLVGGQTPLSWDSPWMVGHWTADDLDGTWYEDPANPVLSPAVGEWDAYTIYNIAVLYDDAGSGTFRMWYGATATYLGQAHVGYAESSDGSTWTKHPGNPLAGLEPGPPGAWDDWGMTPSTVLVDGASFRMWYQTVENNGGPMNLWRLGSATSSDGLTWVKHPDPVLTATEPWEESKLYFPEILPIGGSFTMWYSGLAYKPNPDEARVGCAMSDDGLRWRKWPDNPVVSPLSGCNAFDSFAVIVAGDTVHGWGTNCFWVYHLTAPLEVLFFDGLESGDTASWSAAVP